MEIVMRHQHTAEAVPCAHWTFSPIGLGSSMTSLPLILRVLNSEAITTARS